MIIGIAGQIGSGKDTAADYLCTVYGFKRMSFASALKDACSILFDWDRELLEGSTKYSREWREQVDEWWATRLGISNLTPRMMLQYWGTDLVRENFHNDFWVASLENKLRNTKDDVVITDCRFVNEIAAIKNVGGITLRTHRGEDADWIHIAKKLNTSVDELVKQQYKQELEKLNIHPSEYSSVGLEYDYNIDNNQTIDHLHRQLDSIIRTKKVS